MPLTMQEIMWVLEIIAHRKRECLGVLSLPTSKKLSNTPNWRRQGVAGHGLARLGQAREGSARQGKARSLSCSLVGGGGAWQGWAWRGKARHKKNKQKIGVAP